MAGSEDRLHKLQIFGGPMDGGTITVPESHVVEENVVVTETSEYSVRYLEFTKSWTLVYVQGRNLIDGG